MSSLMAAMLFLAFQASDVPRQAIPVAFEAATIKPTNPDANALGGRCRGIDSPNFTGGNPANNVPLGRCVFRNMDLRILIRAAYGLKKHQPIVGGPDWIRNSRFDIEAKAADPSTATESDLYRMFQNLLAERFKLSLRGELQDADGFALVVAKNGPSLADAASTQGRAGFSMVAGELIGRVVDMRMLADELSFWLAKPVVDRTEIPGSFDLKLRWTPGLGDVPLPPPPPPPGRAIASVGTDTADSPSIFEVLQQQLGLRLQRQKVQAEIIIIERAERPVTPDGDRLWI